MRLSEPSLAGALAEDALATGQVPDAPTQQAHLARVKNQQDGVVNRARALGGREKGRVSKSVNAVAVTIDASQIDALAAAPGVVSVRPVARYHTTQAPAASGSLAQAAQYLGADKVRAAGFDGTGVRVAVLDSGVDFTHRNLGGPGTVGRLRHLLRPERQRRRAARAQALFGPSAPKVKGGFDFVGETVDRRGSRRAGGARPQPDRPRGPRHPRVRHHRRPQRRRHPPRHRAGRRPVRREGVLGREHACSNIGHPAGHRLGPRPQQRR